MRTELGKVQSVRVGYGGYQDAEWGVWFTLGGKSWGVSSGKGCWADWDKHCKWTPEDQRKTFAEVMEYMRDLCKDANVQDVAGLKGVPVECAFDGMLLKSWRVLGEVL